MNRSQVGILFIWQRHGSSFGHFLVVLVKEILVNSDLGRCKSWGSDKFELRISNQLSGEPEERLFEVVVGFGGDVVVLEVLLAVKGDGLRLHFALFDIDLVAAEYDWDVLADTDKVTWLC